MSIRFVGAFLVIICAAFSVRAQGLQWREQKDANKLELLYNGKVLTAYCYFDSTEKPILFPIRTVSGKTVTRGYPISPRAGERTDHPHHTGLFFNYESVNGLDFWNNSFKIPAERKHLYGSIDHKNIISNKASSENASLNTLSHWVDKADNVLLEERTEFTFQVKGNDLIIDRVATLKAVAPEVVFKDVKDGLLGLRVARGLEMPSKEQGKFVDAMGNETTVSAANNDGVTGMYLNAQGIKGDDVWSTRSEWVALSGKLDGESVSVVMIDHKSNVSYPTYWHARGYGLFATNPLGAKVFSQGKSEVNLVLKKGEEKIFRYRVVIHSGSEITHEAINALAADFNRK